MQEIKLSYPIIVDGQKHNSLTMRRCKVKDRRLANKRGKDDEEKEIWLISILTDLTPENIDELDNADYSRVQEVLMTFLKSPSMTSTS